MPEKFEGGPLSSIFNITEALDAVFDTLVAGDVLIWDGDQWSNSSYLLGTVPDTKCTIPLTALYDTDPSIAPAEGHSIFWNDSEGFWETRQGLLADIPDIDMSSAVADSLIVAVDDASMTTIEPPTDSSFLTHDGSVGGLGWVNTRESLVSMLRVGPLICLLGKDSGTSFTGTGSRSLDAPDLVELGSGATALSTAMSIWAVIRGLGVNCGSGDLFIDWSKDFDLFFVSRLHSPDANSVYRLWLAKQNTVGALTDLGFGLRITNTQIALETYGSGGNNIVNGSTIVAQTGAMFHIKKRSTGVYLYKNGVLDALQTDNTKYPASTQTTVNAALCITNGASAQGFAGSVGAFRIVGDL